MTPSRSEQESQSEFSEDTNVTQNSFEKFGSEEDNPATVPSHGHGYCTQGNGKKKRSPPFPPLTGGGVRAKRARK